MRHRLALGAFAGLLLLPAVLAVSAGGQPPPAGVALAAGFQAGSQRLFALDLSRTPVGEFPANLEFLTGTMEVVLKNGVRMLKASASSAFLITLPQVLPADFTLEFDLLPKAGGGPPPDLSVEGTPRINQGGASAHLLWQAEGYLAVIGGAQDNYETPMPDDLRASLPGVRTQVGVSVSGSTIKLYTNGRRLYTLDRQFARGQVLRVFLGGVDDANAVYLAGLRVAIGGATGIAAGNPGGAVNSNTGGLAPGMTPPSQVTRVGANQPANPALPAPPPPSPQPPTAPIAGSNPVTRTGTTTTLAPPTNLVVTGTPAMATLTWQAPSGWTPTGYTVQRQTVGSTTIAMLTTSALSATQFDDRSGFGAGQSYLYTVTALSSNPLASGTARAPFSPPAPQNVSNLIAQQTGTDVTVSWAPVNGASTYVVAGTPTLSRQVPGTQNLTTFTNLPPGTYTWSVGARYDPGAIETPASTWPSVTLSLLNPNTVLVEGNLYKEASRPEIYQVLDGNKIHIPTPDALREMGYTFADVTTVVDGALVNKKLYQFASLSATPGSLVFPIADSYAPILGVPGSTRVRVRERVGGIRVPGSTSTMDTYVTELRGWLWWTEDLDGCDSEGDLKYGLEVDTDWALSQGIDLHRILWVGNLGPSGGGISEPGRTARALVTRPLISMELNSYTWRNLNTDNDKRPAGWDYDKCGTKTFYYPFHPDLPGSIATAVPDIYAGAVQRGPYVRVVGTLLTDVPHTLTLADLKTWLTYAFSPDPDDWNGAVVDWYPGLDPLRDKRHYARWTEVHPPDLIEPATPPANPATMKAIGLAARPTECQSAILTLKPDVPQPLGATVGWEEIVGPETYWPNGKNAQNGSWVTDVGNAIIVNASVCGGGLGNSPGRFKAFYRVWWK